MDSLAQVNAIATHTASAVWANTSAFLVLLILVGVLFIFAWYVGRGPFVALLLSFYAGYAVYIAFPYQSLLPTAPPLTAILVHAGVYAVLCAIFYLILRRCVVSDFFMVGIFGLLILSALGAAFLMAFAFHVFPISTLYHFSPIISGLFGPDQFFFWWFIAPAIGLFFLAN